ncbi:hypothetical protein EVA_02305 [gut metagenome]|uniref:Uncharacterized protein n=1 Tax=gut metagenome TaxID=749906 RepID=J9GPF1_9ZZZZ
MTGDLFINGKDAYTEWGISLDPMSLSALMTPAPNKPLIESKSARMDGKQVIVGTANPPKMDEREITLTLNLTARTETIFFANYEKFCTELSKGILDIRTRFQPQVTYHTIYLSCIQFTQFMRGLAKFSLKLNEPNPKNRK